MDNTTASVSRGVFVFKNNIKLAIKKSKKKDKKPKESSFASYLWYQAYSILWEDFEKQIEDLNYKIHSDVMTNLLTYVVNSFRTPKPEIPTAALLTGINMPDHDAQFVTLRILLKQKITPHVVSLSSRDCQNVKTMMENMIIQFMYPPKDEDDDNEDEQEPLIKKSRMNLSVLECWYRNLYPDFVMQEMHILASPGFMLVVILPDFESFNPTILQKFILIISCYITTLPFVFVFGISTSMSIVHTVLPYNVSSKIGLKIFKLEPSTVFLNNVLENVFFTIHCPFHLGGKIFNLFTDIFLFYDLSASNFIQNIKFAMLEHFCYGNAMALCTLNKKITKKIIVGFNHEDCENVRNLTSFRKLVENETYENQIKLLTNDDYFKSVLETEIIKIQKYIRRLFIFLKCLLILVEDLPKAPLGKQLRELYSVAANKNITKSAEYKECFQLLNFQSKQELSIKLSKIIEFMSNHLKDTKAGKLGECFTELSNFSTKLCNFDMQDMEEAIDDINMESNAENTEPTDRKQFKEKLLEMSTKTKPLNKYEQLRQAVLDSLNEMFEEFLVEPQSYYFHEIYFFDNISIKNYIIGTHRSAIHNALNDPQYYLQCDCCAIPNSSSIKPFMPDICIAYKLHLECGKLINLYDWLQAFLSIVDPTEMEDNSKKIVDPGLQARFTQAVAELEYLGFIKSSKRKTDHVTRLTWGG